METPRLRHLVSHKVLLFLLLVCAPTTVRAGEYRTVEVESLAITIDSEWASQTAPGYVPIRFDITNLAEPRVIEIVGQGTRFFRLGSSSHQAGFEVRQAVRLARGDRVRLTIPVPAFAESQNIRFEIREDDRTLERFGYAGFHGRSLPADASALIVADPESAFGKMAAGLPRRISAASVRLRGGVILPAPGTTSVPPTLRIPAGPSPPLDFLLAPARLPENWLGYTSLRAVVIGPVEWGQLNDAQKSALLTWTACGGDLFFVDGGLSALFAAGQHPPPTAPEGAVRAYFFGRIHLPSSASARASGLSSLFSAAAGQQDANWALPADRADGWGHIVARGFRLPIPGVGGVPARAYLFILIAFSLLIGPANYWLLWRARRQVLLVLTTPLISVFFIALLAGYVVAGEGFGVRARAVTFTMLDEASKQAATRASLSLYAAGMAPSDGLRFARDEAVFTIGPDGTGSREPQVLDLTEMQRFASGAIQARSPTNLETIRFGPARERLGLNRDAGGIRVVNGLGTPIRALIYRAGNTVYRLEGPLLPGRKSTLTAGVGLGAAVVPSGLPLSSRFAYLFEHPPEGSYLAVLERSPFWNPGVASIDERDSFHVVFGWVGGQP